MAKKSSKQSSKAPFTKAQIFKALGLNVGLSIVDNALLETALQTVRQTKEAKRELLLPVEPVVQLATPISRLAVMEGRTLAIAAYNTKLDDDFEILTDDPEERARIEEGMAATEQRIEADMSPYKAAAQMDTDEIIPVGELREWIGALAEMAYQAIGYRRVKNPRIWSLHDIAALSEPRG